MNINLTPHLEDIVRHKVTSGLYAPQARLYARRYASWKRDHALGSNSNNCGGIFGGLDSGEPTRGTRIRLSRRAAKEGQRETPANGYEHALHRSTPASHNRLVESGIISQMTARGERMLLSTFLTANPCTCATAKHWPSAWRTGRRIAKLSGRRYIIFFVPCRKA